MFMLRKKGSNWQSWSPRHCRLGVFLRKFPYTQYVFSRLILSTCRTLILLFAQKAAEDLLCWKSIFGKEDLRSMKTKWTKVWEKCYWELTSITGPSPDVTGDRSSLFARLFSPPQATDSYLPEYHQILCLMLMRKYWPCFSFDYNK